jgi:hypothetical protein
MTAKRTNTLKRGGGTTNGLTDFYPTEAPMMNGSGEAESLRDATRTTDISPSDSEDLEIEIQRRAYEIFLTRGGGDGDDLTDWLEAERIVRRDRESAIS